MAFPDRVAEQHRQERRESMDKARLLTSVPAQRTGEQDYELRAEVALLNGLLEQADKELSELDRTSTWPSGRTRRRATSSRPSSSSGTTRSRTT
ncbi:hypothetical protein ACFWIY_25965 [Streptomyces sioyaensis]|uniref:hypothetical protein n=1 Tax=Streptomyces sioyaensis TaxID=67364 RepID=UPI00364AF797